jgi:hypothetical protein
MRRIKKNVRRVARPKLQPVAAIELLPLNPFAVDERPMLAPQVDQEKLLALLCDLRMVARYARIGDHQILVHLPPHRERRAVQDNILLLASLHKHQRRENSRARTMVTDGA